MMNEPEVVTQLLEQIDEQKALADRYRSALQDIREIEIWGHEDAFEMKQTAIAALKEGE